MKVGDKWKKRWSEIESQTKKQNFSDFLSISIFFSFNTKKFFFHEMSKKKSVLYSLLKTFFAKSWLCFSPKPERKNTTNLQVIQKQYISPVWCLITIVARIESFPGVPGFICNCAALFWNLKMRFLGFGNTANRFCAAFKFIIGDSIDPIKVLFSCFSMKSEIVVQALITKV